MDRGPTYRVRIVYTEPAFQARLAAAPDFYTIDYLVGDARSPDAAVKAAMLEWDHCVANSRVGWGRCIDSIVIRQQAAGESPAGWEISCREPEARAGDDGWQVTMHRRHLEDRRD